MGATLLLLGATPSWGLNGDPLDGPGHPNVGAILVARAGEREPVCSGALLSKSAFLTAGDCLSRLERRGIAAERVYVTFDTSISARSYLIRATGYQVQDTAGASGLGVIELAPATRAGTTAAAMPSAGLLDGTHGDPFLGVGYGPTQRVAGWRSIFGYDGRRKTLDLVATAVHSERLRLLPATTARWLPGSACAAGPGAPVFLPETNVVVAIHLGRCGRRGAAYRLDTTEARAFLGDFASLP